MYVNDIILTGDSVTKFENLKSFLQSLFLIKDLGKLKYFFGIEVIKTNIGVCLTHRKYCLEFLHEFGLLGYKPVQIPLDPSFKVNKDGINNSNDL